MYSLNDSIIRPEELIARLKEIGQTAIAITDHGNLYAGVHIYKLCKEHDIKYIHGCEMYIFNDLAARGQKSRQENRPERYYYHLIVLCKNEQGRLNLNKLVSLSELPENFYYKPRIDFDMLKEHKDGLIVCSACLVGELAQLITADRYDEAVARALQYKEVFGEDYYIEIQSHNEKEQIAVNKKLVQLAEETGIELVVTTDAHYAWEKDKQYQNIYAFNGKYKEDGENYPDCFLQSEQEVRDRLEYLPQKVVDRAIHNTQVITDKCNVELPLSAPIMPKVETPPEYKDNLSWLQEICRNGCRQKLGFDIDTLEDAENPTVPREERQKYKDRYEYEMDSLSRMGFVDYTLLVYSYANVGKRRGKGRGSGGGSLVNYLSNITDIDPIEHDLYFERYVDVSALKALERGEITAKELKIPDVDLDFSGEDCVKVLQWLKNKYGETHVASIGRFGVNHTKSSIRDLCKTMGIDLEIADMIAKSFGETQIEYLDSIIESGERIPENLKEAYEYTQRYPRLFDYVRKLSGLPKSFGTHPCGKICSVNELDYYLPSCYDDNGVRYLQGDQHDVEDVGLVKVDILGLRTLDQEYDTLEMAELGEEFINPKQKYDDDKVWEIFRSGDTGGIFQFSSKGMKETLKKMNASSIDELSIANALFRPGAMAHIDEYCNRKHGKEEVTYYHPDLEPILKNTYGIIVFQEQLIQIARLAKMRNPDILRKMVGKKSAALIPVVKPELHDGLIARGWSEEQFDTLWEVILASCSYMFNKCVSGDTRFAGNIITIEQQYKAGIYTRAFSRCDNGDVRFNDVLNIQQSGVRQLYEVETETGRWVECTDNHQFPTPKGKKKLSELHVGDELYIFNYYDRGLRGGRTGTDKISVVRPTKKAMTYDVTMAAPNHNFIVNNGLVVSNSHSSAYAILAYMTAKLKAYYPAEFFAGLLNSYIGESNFVKETGEEIFSDIARHKIRYAPLSFRNDHRRCSVKDGKIVYAIPLIKGMNENVAEIMYKNREFDDKYFFELLFRLFNDGLRKSMLEKLIALDFFAEFGNSVQLRRVLEACEFIKWGEKNVMMKRSAAKNTELDKIISNHSTDFNDKGKQVASYLGIRWHEVMQEYEERLRNAEIPDVNIKVKVVNQKEMLGLAPFPTGREEDRSLLYVTDVKPLCAKATGKQFGYSVFTSSFGSGINTRFSVKGKAYREWAANPISPNDIIRCTGYESDGGYWSLTSWKQVYS